jgi:hypothetical protein
MRISREHVRTTPAKSLVANDHLLFRKLLPQGGMGSQ